MPTASDDAAARTGHQTFLNLGFKARKLLHGHAERLELLGGRIDGEVVGGHQHAGGDKGHDGHEASISMAP